MKLDASGGSVSDTPYFWKDWGYVYTYDGSGPTSKSYVVATKEKRLPSGELLPWWQADSTEGYDHLDRPVKVRKGNGHWTVRTYRATDGLLTALATGPTLGSSQIQNLTFAYDGLGNLTGRTGAASESFTYDSLNRLTTGGMGYAANGNILSKAAVDGTTLSGYTYSGTKPHAVTGVTATIGTAVATYSYDYDANGNLTTRERREGGIVKETWSTRWAGFDKPRWLAKTDSSTGTAKTTGSEFLYNANRSRVVHLEFDAMANGAPSRYVRKKVYGLGPQLEADYRNDAKKGSGAVPAPVWKLDKLRIYVPGPEGIIGTMEFGPTARSSKPETALVYHYDHLGSIERITPYGSTSTTYVLDGAGRQSRYSYDAWGQRRDPNDWSGKPETTADGGADDATPRGFTGHEMLDDLGLVHMNGRIYDPLLGRFLSADLVVQNPTSLQCFNRYSYVMNSPLTLTDPSGFEAILKRDPTDDPWQRPKIPRTRSMLDSLDNNKPKLERDLLNPFWGPSPGGAPCSDQHRRDAQNPHRQPMGLFADPVGDSETTSDEVETAADEADTSKPKVPEVRFRIVTDSSYASEIDANNAVEAAVAHSRSELTAAFPGYHFVFERAGAISLSPEGGSVYSIATPADGGLPYSEDYKNIASALKTLATDRSIGVLVTNYSLSRPNSGARGLALEAQRGFVVGYGSTVNTFLHEFGHIIGLADGPYHRAFLKGGRVLPQAIMRTPTPDDPVSLGDSRVFGYYLNRFTSR